MRLLTTLVATLIIALVSGCGDRKEPNVYNVPKETAPTMPPRPMASQMLPEGSVNRDSQPNWTVPAHWTETEGSPMRRGSFGIEAPEGPIDISVTSFPGDVGGPLANLNRWRGQLSLAPVGEDALARNYTEIAGGHMRATLAEMDNGDHMTLAATIVHVGNSWFFKMSGPKVAVEREKASFLDFIRSVDLHQH